MQQLVFIFLEGKSNISKNIINQITVIADFSNNHKLANSGIDEGDSL